MKKKQLLIAVSLMMGAAATCSAAASPFSDVPSGHWAYDAVAQLAENGIIEGYGDSTFRGERQITRYEMAQMVAKAMARNANGADKALVDRLAEEFSEELSNLGVRVSHLEKHADRVRWSGIFAQKAMSGNSDKHTWWEKELFLNVDAAVNDQWNVHAGIDTKWGTNTNGWNGE